MAITPLATIQDLEGRLDFDLDDSSLITMAENALQDATVLVRAHGSESWTADTAPPIAVMLTLKAAARYMNNPAGMELSRGADETASWRDSGSDGVHLKDDEIELLHKHAHRSKGFQSVGTTAWGTPPVRRALAHQNPVVGYGQGDAKWFPDYRPGDVYDPFYPSDRW